MDIGTDVVFVITIIIISYRISYYTVGLFNIAQEIGRNAYSYVSYLIMILTID